MQIGRKIYYEKSTGNVLLEIGEKQGDIAPTSLETDFQTYTILLQRVKDTVGVVQLIYGQDDDKFGLYAYHIDITTQSIVWGDLIVINVPVPQPTIAEVLAGQQAIQNGMADMFITLLSIPGVV